MSEQEMRAMDAVIAEKVMFCKPEVTFDLKDRRTNLSTLEFNTKAEADAFLERYVATHGEGAEFRYVNERRIYPHYTTSNADALMVLEAICKNSPYYSVSVLCFQGEWIISQHDLLAKAETLPLAICQFAYALVV